MDVTIPVASDGIPGYLAVPDPAEGAGPWPGVVVVHDLFGLGNDIRSITARFAAAGYLAVAPDLYSRGGRLRCMRATLAQVQRGFGEAFADIEAARELLRSRDDCTGAVGIAGFCMGGGFALLLAPGFDASAPYYGMLPRDSSALDEACPIVASFGADDRTLRGAAAQLEQQLEERGIPHDVEEYPGAGHAFANQFPGPFGALARVAGFGYRQDAAEDAWRRVTRFFAEHLVAAET